MLKKNLSFNLEKRESSLIFTETLNDLYQFLPDKPIFLLTDSNLAAIYPDFIQKFPCIILPAGENHKNLTSVQLILEELLEKGADRDSFLLGFGGGVIGDMAGFAASIYMRGISFGFVPTSLLAMVDASVGGKNGVNLNSWKNMAGTFTQPEFVFIYPEWLHSLPEREFNSGMAEVIKHAVIGSEKHFIFLEENRESIKKKELPILYEMIQKSVLFKASIVEQDEKETGIRRILNFGHTLGHSIEREQVYNHGESISLGIALALKISEIHCQLNPEITRRIIHLLDFFHLPTTQFPTSETLISNSKKDKKKAGSRIHFIFLKNAGQPIVEAIDFQQLEKYLSKLC